MQPERLGRSTGFSARHPNPMPNKILNNLPPMAVVLVIDYRLLNDMGVDKQKIDDDILDRHAAQWEKY
jgi:hypothetical protein